MAVITISRQFGAGAMKLGKMLAEKFGYTLASREIVQGIADKAKVSTDFVLSVEKEAGTRLSRFMTRIISSRGMVNKILRDDSGYIDEKLYLDYLVLTIVQIADEGNAVIMGRGSQYILRSHPDAVHILLVDDLENRIKRVERREKTSYEQAARIVHHEDKRRLSLYHRLGKQDYDSPSLYHMVLNMSRLTRPQAFEMIRRIVDSMGSPPPATT
ncbi:MAG: cytidylate kinase-like family protein [Desulfobacterales bacterium]|nr:cytidylate kinase-like family protein [Desulfobacterales bacterium]